MTDLQTRIENANPRPDWGADDLIPPFDAIWLAAQQTVASEDARITRRRTASSRLVTAGVAITVAGGGYAAAAASGVVPSPWSGPAVNTFVASADPAGTVRLAVPGPESTTLQIVTDTVACRERHRGMHGARRQRTPRTIRACHERVWRPVCRASRERRLRLASTFRCHLLDRHRRSTGQCGHGFPDGPQRHSRHRADGRRVLRGLCPSAGDAR